MIHPKHVSTAFQVATGLLQKYRESWQRQVCENRQLRSQQSSALQRLGEARLRVAARSASPGGPHLLAVDGKAMFRLKERGVDYRLGWAKECHFLLPRTLVISKEESDRSPRCLEILARKRAFPLCWSEIVAKRRCFSLGGARKRAGALG